jgi:hypothetical protein
VVIAKEIDQKAISVSMPIDGKFRVGLYSNQVSKKWGISSTAQIIDILI